MKTNIKEKIIKAGAEIIHKKGFNHTGIQEILSASGVPKGSFYFYFKNKEDFGLHVIDYFMGLFTQTSNLILKDHTLSPLQRMNSLFDGFMKVFKSMGYSCGCPIGNLSQEMGDLSSKFRDKLNASVDLMAAMFSRLIDEAKVAGEIDDAIDSSEAAHFIVSSWHGALIRMKIVKNSNPLEIHKKYILDHVLKS